MEKQYRISFEVSFTVKCDEDLLWRETDKLYDNLRTLTASNTEQFMDMRTRVNHLGASETIPNGHGACISIPFMFNFDRELANYNSNYKYIHRSNPDADYLANLAKLAGVEYESFWDSFVGVMPNMKREELIKFWSRYQHRFQEEAQKLTANILQKLHAERIEGQYEDGLI